MQFNKDYNEIANQISLHSSGGSSSTMSLDASIKALLFIPAILIAVGLLLVDLSTLIFTIPALILWGVIISGIRVPNQWETLVVFTFGKFSRVRGPGFRYVVPFIEYGFKVDMRVLTLEIPRQSVITKDNVPIEIDGVLFFKVHDASMAIINIQDYRYAVKEYARNSLRDVVGGLSLDDVLTEREKIQEDIRAHILDKVHAWGLEVDSIRLQDIQMPEDLKRMMSRQASAEREKRATIIKAEGDKLASINLSGAAEIMNQNPGAMQLRTLQTIDGLGASPSNTVVLFPIEIMETFGKFLEIYCQKNVENEPSGKE